MRNAVLGAGTRRVSVWLSTLGLALLSVSPARADTFMEDFDSGSLSAQLEVLTDPGFNLSLTGGGARMDQAAGAGNGSVFLNTKFVGVGDFVATVQANRNGLGSAELGLEADYGDPKGMGNRADVFFVNTNLINANITVPGGTQTFGSIADASTDVVFRIRRVGQTVLSEVDNGGGFVTVHSRSNPALMAPARFGLFLIQEFGSRASNHGSFDTWSITADSIVSVPEPSSCYVRGYPRRSIPRTARVIGASNP